LNNLVYRIQGWVQYVETGKPTSATTGKILVKHTYKGYNIDSSSKLNHFVFLYAELWEIEFAIISLIAIRVIIGEVPNLLFRGGINFD